MAKILLIDDDAVMREIVTRTLEPAGHAVATCPNGRKALEYLAHSPADLLITDIVMPEMDGVEILRAVRQSQPDLPILAISGGGSFEPEGYLSVAQSFGASAILAKPFPPAELVALVAQLMQNAGNPAARREESRMTDVRKIVTLREVVLAELGRAGARPIVRAVGIGVIRNPFAGQWAEDLRPLFEVGAALGERLMPELVAMLEGPAVSYGKGALVGVAGEMEHGGACVHPMLGRPMRAAIGGGQAVIGSTVKVAAAGALLDVPLGHKDDPWSFEHFDTITISVADAPRPDEIVVVMAIADGGRLNNRCGTGPIR